MLKNFDIIKCKAPKVACTTSLTQDNCHCKKRLQCSSTVDHLTSTKKKLPVSKILLFLKEVLLKVQMTYFLTRVSLYMTPIPHWIQNTIFSILYFGAFQSGWNVMWGAVDITPTYYVGVGNLYAHMERLLMIWMEIQ